MLQALTTLLVLAVACEHIVQWAKEAAEPLIARYQPKEPKLVATCERLVALAAGTLLAAGARQDLLALLGVQYAYPVVGVALAGLAVSRGANWIHEFMDRINAVTKK